MVKSRPEIQSRQVQSELEGLELLGDDVKKRILGRISESTLQAINGTKEDKWIPVEYNVELCESVSAEIGEEGYFNWFAKVATIAIKSLVVGPFFLAALNMVKIKPKTFIELAPRLWKSIYRNCGELSAVNKDRSVTHLILNELPSVMVASRPCLVSIAAFVKGLMDFSGANMKVVLDRYSEKTKSAVIVVTAVKNS